MYLPMCTVSRTGHTLCPMLFICLFWWEISYQVNYSITILTSHTSEDLVCLRKNVLGLKDLMSTGTYLLPHEDDGNGQGTMALSTWRCLQKMSQIHGCLRMFWSRYNEWMTFTLDLNKNGVMSCFKYSNINIPNWWEKSLTNDIIECSKYTFLLVNGVFFYSPMILSLVTCNELK